MRFDRKQSRVRKIRKTVKDFIYKKRLDKLGLYILLERRMIDYVTENFKTINDFSNHGRHFLQSFSTNWK